MIPHERKLISKFGRLDDEALSSKTGFSLPSDSFPILFTKYVERSHGLSWNLPRTLLLGLRPEKMLLPKNSEAEGEKADEKNGTSVQYAIERRRNDRKGENVFPAKIYVQKKKKRAISNTTSTKTSEVGGRKKPPRGGGGGGGEGRVKKKPLK